MSLVCECHLSGSEGLASIGVRAGGEGGGGGRASSSGKLWNFSGKTLKIQAVAIGRKNKNTEEEKKNNEKTALTVRKVVERLLPLLTHVFVSRRITVSVLIVFFAYKFVTGIAWLAGLHSG